MAEISTKRKSIPEKIWGHFAQPELGVVLLSLVLFGYVNKALENLKTVDLLWVPSITVLALIMCVLAPGPAWKDVSKPVKIVALTIAVVMGLYAIAARITIPIGFDPIFDMALEIVDLSTALGALGAIAAFWRPAFVFLPCAVVLQQKAMAAQMFGIHISQTDYIPLLEMGLYLGMALMLLGPGLPTRLGPISRLFRRCDRNWVMVLIFMAAVSAHLSNYFFSGLQKLVLDGGPWLWVLQNPTHILGANAYLSGYLPIGAYELLSFRALHGLEILRPALNAIILIGQLGAIIFVSRRSMLIGATLFYDFTHVAIFFASGIMFWKWVVLNSALVAAMRYLPKAAERKTAVALSIFVILAAPEAFHIVRLGWYDTPALTRPRIIAVTEKGTEYEVPSNYFGSISITAAQHRLGRVSEGHFPTRTFGSTPSASIFDAANDNCYFTDQTFTLYKRDKEDIAGVIEKTHLYAIQQAADDGRYRYDLFPHHIWSNPWMFQEFAKLDPRTIEKYIYRTISSCVHLERGRPVEDVRITDEFVIPVNHLANQDQI